jgi:hypothetical protein
MDIGLENRLYRVLISLVLENKGDRTLGRKGRSYFGKNKGDRISLAPELL